VSTVDLNYGKRKNVPKRDNRTTIDETRSFFLTVLVMFPESMSLVFQ
jgi:hypothetical protein